MVLAIGGGGGLEGNHQAEVGLNNDSLLAIESDLVAIEEKELETMYHLENSSSLPNNHHPHSSSHVEPSMKGFMEHMAFHLWFFLPCVILLVPPQPKFIDKIVQKLFVAKRKNDEKSKTFIGNRHEWKHDNLRGPLVTTLLLLLSSAWGLFWALLHLNSRVISPSVLAGIIFWTSSFAFGCIVKMTILLWRWIPFRFDHDVEKVYNDLCAPFRLERADFARILCCMREIKVLKHGQDYVTEKMTPVDSLSLVLSGRLLVRQSGKLLHVVPRLHFVDSPEWFGVAADDLFQISATALEETKVLVWHRDKLKLTLMENPYLHTVFEHIVARDVVKKLTQTHDGTSLDHLDKKAECRPSKPTIVQRNGTVSVFNNDFNKYSPTNGNLSRISELEEMCI